IFPDFPPFPGNPKQEPSGFTELRAALAREALALGKPVVLVHGDSHYFRVDKPYMRMRKAGEPGLENVTRIETFGSLHHHWVEATVDPADPNVFSFPPAHRSGQPFEGAIGRPAPTPTSEFGLLDHLWPGVRSHHRDPADLDSLGALLKI